MLRLTSSAMGANEPDEGGERGVCVQTASIAGYEGQIGQIAYGSAKAGVIGMTIIAARDLCRGRVCGCARSRRARSRPRRCRPHRRRCRRRSPNGVPFPKRLGEPAEFAALAQHIVENGYLNGEVIRLDGAVRFQPR